MRLGVIGGEAATYGVPGEGCAGFPVALTVFVSVCVQTYCRVFCFPPWIYYGHGMALSVIDVLCSCSAQVLSVGARPAPGFRRLLFSSQILTLRIKSKVFTMY